MDEVEIRLATYEDKKYLVKWLSDPDTLRWYPMSNEREIEDAANIWISYVKYKAVITALYNGQPAGIANLYLQHLKKVSHQCLLAIVVGKDFRNKGIGTRLIQELIKMGQEQFHLKYLHLEVYENNPAFSLYQRLGFEKFGEQKNFIKEQDRYRSKIFMQRKLV